MTTKLRTASFQDNAVTSAKIAADAITAAKIPANAIGPSEFCLLYTSPSPRDVEESRMPSSA